ncbi:uncharacterized protein LOC62_04G005750 [Vanrija pseudolonga]|uniref:Uncharacterized protein n=1 Tax=Vanrija pseudolonga TaxID=143232 RepID=A0AAF0YEE5_9TREE|nr:hypothetical protein LOC62_04G005750 [Vanrija pseudolonga]
MSAPVPIATTPQRPYFPHLASSVGSMTDEDWRAMRPAATDISPLSTPANTPLGERDSYCAYASLGEVMHHFESFSCVNLST